ncbi:hypothetical protein [Pseudomonas petrae]|uniref:hypothetical protein n=1 Tax=Pseudomonas petrae TaxID=2912190 RepID=UPI001EF09ED4|nr:hypothetical protein [Pseudomonas petrae]MCF7535380.1 hypothetical protein [Pseudomonas petrae]MCF7558683.1 hypothetical protein [Pseudomonas petrae]
MDAVKLLVYPVFLPVAFTTTINLLEDKSMKWLDFDPHTTFLKLKAVVYVVATIFALAATVTFTIVCFTSGLKLNFSSQGWNNALEIFKVPLGLLAVAIPLIALLAANHRSVQSKAQMELTQFQINHTQTNNYVTNYYKHVDEFQKYLGSHHFGFTEEKEGHPEVAYPRKLHKTLFPEARRGILTVDKEFIITFIADLEKILSITSVFEASYYDKRLQGCIDINRKLESLARKNFIVGFRSQDFPHIVHEGGVVKSGPTVREIIRPIGIIATILNEAMLFDETYDVPEILRQLTAFRFDLVPDDVPDNSVNYHFKRQLLDQTMQWPDDED